MIEVKDGWEFCWTEYAGRERPCLTESEALNLTWYTATVPGNAQRDLVRLGEADDPFYADNADHLRWCEEVDFWYRCKIRGVEDDGAHQILDFGGLDTFATVWINGVEVGRHENMFIPFSIDVTGHVTSDHSAELLMRFGASAFECDYNDRDPNSHPPLQRTRTRRAQITYGWDIGPRLVAVGPWRPVTLSAVNSGRILHSGARTVSVGDGEVSIELVATVEWFDKPADATVTFAWDGYEMTQDVRLASGIHDVVVATTVKNPTLWWPNGMGEQHLYTLSTSLAAESGDIHDQRESSFGICRVDLVEEPRPDGALGFGFTVNGQEYFAKGMNWTPSEALFGTLKDDRTEMLVRMAAEANINMFRVWGGGIYEDDSFWDACDRHGILVWQDFMFACSLYPQDQAFLNRVTEEAEQAVRAFRGHVSLAAWCGDNEIDTLCGPESGTIVSRKTLKDVVARLDDKRPYVVSSLFSEPGRHPNDPESGDCHMWRHTLRHDDSFYTGTSANFVSEIGRISFPDRETIDLFMPEDKMWPPMGPLWRYHASDTNRTRRYRSVADVLECVRNTGYEMPEDIDTLIETTQTIQADAYRFWIEHFGGDPQCKGLLLWNLCDIWPQISDAVISYDLRPKKAYYAVRDAYGDLDR